MAHIRNMGHMKDTVPELSADLILKDFMTQHVTNYWPAVFRGLGQQMPAFEKWQND